MMTNGAMVKLACFKGRRGSLILVDIPLRDSASIKILAGGNLKIRLICE